ncbi:hypothetical protein PMI15_00562 [Polaromonas sp. CF318]|nr:hypothetical protein PMI15_00562 [Polaromonas sp. CF318]
MYVGAAVLTLGLGLLFALFFFKITIVFSFLGVMAWVAIAWRCWGSDVRFVRILAVCMFPPVLLLLFVGPSIKRAEKASSS